MFLGLITYGFLSAVGAGAVHVLGDAADVIVALVAYVLLLAVVAAYTGARELDAGFAVAPNLLVCGNAVLVIASLAAAYLLLDWLAAPDWAFVVLVLSLVATVYPMVAYQTAGGLIGSDDGDDSPPWAADVDPTDEPSPRERAALLAGQLRSTAAAAARPDPLWALAVGLAAAGGLSLVYLLSTVRSQSGTVVPVTVAVTALVVAGHVVDVVRTELADAVVLRELDTAARRIDDAPTATPLDERVTGLAAQADIPAPDVRLVSSATPTARAIGYRPGSSTIFLSTKLLEVLDEAELEAVLT